jgi:membrane-bound metal-dependent hydrolase YbcI (DUF457 family)
MFIGHFAPALIAATHRKAPRLSLLFVAAQLVDIGFFVFVMLGVERMRIVPGITAMNPMDLYHMPYTHSLLGGAAWGLGYAVFLWLLLKNRSAALIGFAVVLSHWFLDLIVHRADMTLLGGELKLGFGLWNYPMIEMPLELALTGGALAIYLIKTQSVDGASNRPAWILGATLMIVQLYNWFAPQPTTMDASLPVMALVAFGLFIWLAFRLDRTRTTKGAGEIV